MTIVFFSGTGGLKLAPVTCTVARKTVKEDGGEGSIEHTVVPNVALWNVDFQ
jgi:hypothetical protein